MNKQTHQTLHPGEIIFKHTIPYALFKTLIRTSLCIPRVDGHFTLDFIRDVFLKWNIGFICNIKEIPLRNDPANKRIIIKLLCNNENATMIKETMDKFGTIKLVYDIPWYWKISYTIQNKKYTTTGDTDTTTNTTTTTTTNTNTNTNTEQNNICDDGDDGDDSDDSDETKKAATAATAAIH